MTGKKKVLNKNVDISGSAASILMSIMNPTMLLECNAESVESSFKEKKG